MIKLYKTTKLGFEIYILIADRKVVGEFMSEQGARTKMLQMVSR